MTDLNLAAGGSQKRLDIDTVKRNAPTIHNSQARSEITQMASERVIVCSFQHLSSHSLINDLNGSTMNLVSFFVANVICL